MGLLRFAARYIDAAIEQEHCKKIFEMPFSSQTKWHLTVHQLAHDHGYYTVFIKGAPEQVAKMCTSMQVDDKVE